MTSTPSDFRSFADVQAYLDGLGMFHMDLGLGRVDDTLSNLGLVRPPYRVAHVVGTNGKGSTSRMLAEAAMGHGLHTGLYGSPHFVTPRERVLVDGRMLSEDTWVRLGNEVLAASGPAGLTYFEFITVLAALAFAHAEVDVAVMEAGLGGRYDACTSMVADLVVFTPIGLDHTTVLGDTLAEIAIDKAGALRAGVPAVTAPQDAEAMDMLAGAAAFRGALLSLPDAVPGPVPDALHPAMPGPHQRDNARLALAAWRMLAAHMGVVVDADACADAVSRARVAGRLQRISGEQGGPELILDGAHNPHALTALAAALDAEGIRPAAVMFGCMRDKDMTTMGPLVAALTDGPLVAVGLPGMDRAMPVNDLAAALADVRGLSPCPSGKGGAAARADADGQSGRCAGGQGFDASAGEAGPDSDGRNAVGTKVKPVHGADASVHAAEDMAAALALAADFTGPVLICGSLYLLGEFFSLRPECLGQEGPDVAL